MSPALDVIRVCHIEASFEELPLEDPPTTPTNK